MDNKNIVLFSSGISEQSGLLASFRATLAHMGYCCADWRDLFHTAKDMDHIALLPTLIKKIPTFDYALLICEGHDLTTIVRKNETVQVRSMRDNVLFEIGLCTMALGLSRTILITDRDVRLPDDLIGIHHSLAVKQFFLPDQNDRQAMTLLCSQIDEYIRLNGDMLHQVVIGAASSTACGYVSNFICRTLEHVDEDIYFTMDGSTKILRVPAEKIYLHICLPDTIDSGALNDLRHGSRDLIKGSIPSARSRPADFSCYFDEDRLHIVDCPTNIVTSYDTARIILEMDADDTDDPTAADRFNAKELKLYEATLRRLLNRPFIARIIDEYYAELSYAAQQTMIDRITDIITNRLTITRQPQKGSRT